MPSRSALPPPRLRVAKAHIPATYEASFGVPMMGAVFNTLNTLNIRLDFEAIAFRLARSEASVAH